MFEKCQHAQTTGLFPPYRVKFSWNTQSIPVKICLVWQKNSSLLVILPFIKQGLARAAAGCGIGNANS